MKKYAYFVLCLVLATLSFACNRRMTVDDMLKAGRYDLVDPGVTEKNFPVNPALFTASGSKVFHFSDSMTTPEVITALGAEGYEPASIEQLLAYGAENPAMQRDGPIVALGSHEAGSRYRVPCLYGNVLGRGVDLHWDDRGVLWDSRHFRFLAVPLVRR